jgi:hypothetical protein
LVRVPWEGAIKPTCGNPACPAPVSVHGTLSGGGGFSRVEQTLLEGGRGAAVIDLVDEPELANRATSRVNEHPKRYAATPPTRPAPTRALVSRDRAAAHGRRCRPRGRRRCDSTTPPKRTPDRGSRLKTNSHRGPLKVETVSLGMDALRSGPPRYLSPAGPPSCFEPDREHRSAAGIYPKSGFRSARSGVEHRCGRSSPVRREER